MSKRSQRYIVLQNLSSHYHKLKGAQPSIGTKNIFNTLQESKNKYRYSLIKKQEIEKSIEVERSNKILCKNLLNITMKQSTSFNRGQSINKKREKLQKSKRQTTKSFFKQKYLTQREHKNKLILNKLLTVQPEVGNVHQWRNEYKIHEYHKKRLTKNDNILEVKTQRKLKDKIQQYEKHFIQQIYKKDKKYKQYRKDKRGLSTNKSSKIVNSSLSELCQKHKKQTEDEDDIGVIKQKYLLQLF